jgi:hypothetical protein
MSADGCRLNRSILAGGGLSANDPTATLAARTNPDNLEVMRAVLPSHLNPN